MSVSPWTRARGPVARDRQHRIRPQLELLERRELLSANVLVNNPAYDTTSRDTQSETSLVLDTNVRNAAGNPAIIVAYNDFSASINGPHLIRSSNSTNGGSSFAVSNPSSNGILPGINGDGGDPALVFSDKTGNVYLSALSYNTSNQLQFYTSKPTANGQNWSAPVNSAPGFFPYWNALDKDWLAVDPGAASSGQDVLYQSFTDYNFFGYIDNGIFLTRSTNSGAVWQLANGGYRINTGGNGVQGSDVVVGPNHAVYVFWWDDNNFLSERLMMRMSMNFGQSFGPTVQVTTLHTNSINGDLGLTTGNAGPTPNRAFRTNAFPQAVVNPENPNDIYVVYDDKGVKVGDKADIFFTESTNGGTSWTTPIKVNDDNTIRDQWQPALSVTPDGRHLFITWYDRRNDPNNSLIERYGVIGNTNFTSNGVVAFGANFKITRPDPGSLTSNFPAVVGQDSSTKSGYMGDYDQAAADNTYFYTTWGDNRLSDASHTNQPDVRFAKIDMSGNVFYSSTSAPASALASGTTTGGTAQSTTQPLLSFDSSVARNEQEIVQGVAQGLFSDTPAPAFIKSLLSNGVMSNASVGGGSLGSQSEGSLEGERRKANPSGALGMIFSRMVRRDKLSDLALLPELAQAVEQFLADNSSQSEFVL